MSNLNEKEVYPEAKEKVNNWPMHPDSYLFKGIGLIFMCMIGLGHYFCYDVPGAMEVNLFDYNTFVLIMFNYLIILLPIQFRRQISSVLV